MARLPTIGGDSGAWGTVLNEWLAKGGLAFNVKDGYGAVGDGVADDTAEIQAAITAASSAGGGVVFQPDGVYRVTDTMLVPSNVHVVADRNATIHVDAAMVDAGVSVFHALGTDGAKTNLGANAAAGAFVVTLPAAHGIVAGDWLGLEAATVVLGTDGYAREIHRVISVAGNDITLDGPLTWGYLTSATAQFWKMTPVDNISFQNLTFTNDDPTTNTGYCIKAHRATNVLIENVTLLDCGGGIGLHDVIDGRVDGLLVDRLQNKADSYGYGIWLAGASANFTIDGFRARDTRHAFTTLSDNRDPTFWGGPRLVTVNGGVGTGGPDSLAVWDTHEYGYDITFNGCIAHGGNSGWQIRCKKVSLNGCRSYGPELRNVDVRSTTEDVQIVGGEFSWATSNGINLAGARGSLIGAHVHHSGIDNVVVSGTDCQVKSCFIHDAGQVTSGQSGIVDSSATRLYVIGNTIPFTTTVQTVGVEGLAATGVALSNICLGYTGANAFFAAADAATIRDNIIGAVGSVASAATITLPDTGVEIVSVTGTTNITSVTAGFPGRKVTLRFDGILTFTDGSNLFLAGNFVTTAEDTITLVCNGTNWYEISRSVN